MAKATLTSPDWLYKTVVDTGTAQASTLLSWWWKLWSAWKKSIDMPLAMSLNKIANSNITQNAQQQTRPLTNIQDVVNTFVRYYGRQPKPEDMKHLEYLSTKPPQEVEATLKKNSPIEKNTANSLATTNDVEARRQAGLAYIKSQNLSPEMEIIMKQLLEDGLSTQWKVFTKDDVASMLDTATKNAEANISPYYQKQTTQEIEDVKNKLKDIRNEAARYSQQEAKWYKELLDTTRQKLRASGLTFSGVSRQTLGWEWALNRSQDTWEGGNTQFNMVEGEIPQQRRYNWEDKTAGWQEQSRDLWIKTERSLGSQWMEQAWLSGLQVLNPYYWISPDSPDYQANKTQDQYLVKKTINWVPQEWYIRTGNQWQFLTNGKESTYSDANYRYLSETELARQAAIEKARQASLTALMKPTSTR